MGMSLYIFILESHDDTELSNLCEDERFKNDKSEKVTSTFSAEMGKNEKVRRLIDFCKRHGLYPILWEKVKQENKTKWAACQMPETDTEPESAAGQTRQSRSQVDGVFGAIKTVETIDAQTISSETPSSQTHPLAQEEANLKKWFLDSLNSDEQVFLLTSALFRGLEKIEFLSIYDIINVGLNATDTDEDENNNGN